LEGEDIVKEGGETGEALGDLTVIRAQSMFFAYWKLLAFSCSNRPVYHYQWLSKPVLHCFDEISAWLPFP